LLQKFTVSGEVAGRILPLHFLEHSARAIQPVNLRLKHEGREPRGAFRHRRQRSAQYPQIVTREDTDHDEDSDEDPQAKSKRQPIAIALAECARSPLRISAYGQMRKHNT
jgi:hypothetical protein